jgi:hypothetical protein
MEAQVDIRAVVADTEAVGIHLAEDILAAAFTCLVEVVTEGVEDTVEVPRTSLAVGTTLAAGTGAEVGALAPPGKHQRDTPEVTTTSAPMELYPKPADIRTVPFPLQRETTLQHTINRIGLVSIGH